MANMAPRVTLRQLVQYFYDTDEYIQVCEPGGEWEDYNTFRCTSKFIEPFLDYEIKELAVVKDYTPIFRVDLDIPEEGDA